MTKSVLFACTMLSAGVLASAVHAQSTAAANSAPSADSAVQTNAAPPSAAPPADQAATIPEVVVTAEKRSQSLQTVPVAVSAFTSQTRDAIGILTTKDLTNYTPGLTYSSSLDRITLRGIGRFTNDLTADPGIANYTDGVYSSFAVASSEDQLFIDRVEILRGPQGTLYGRNAIGGAINVISKQPLDTFQGEARVTVANYDRQEYAGFITGPLPSFLDQGPFEHWDYRISYKHTEQDEGYFKDLGGGLPSQDEVHDENYYEVQLKGKVTDKVDLWGKWDSQQYDNKAPPGLVHTGGSFNPTPDPELFPAGSLSPSNGYAYTSGAVNPVFYGPAVYNPVTATGNLRLFNNNTNFGNRVSHNNSYNFSAVYHGDGFDVKYLTGWLKYHYDQIYDYDGTNVEQYTVPLQFVPTASNPLGSTCALSQYAFANGIAGGAPCTAATIYPSLIGWYSERKEFYSHEINVSSTGNGPVQWLAGLYYYNENYTQEFYIANPDQAQVATPILAGAPNPKRFLYYTNTPFQGASEAVFGQVDWKFFPNFKLTAGLRYSADQKNGTEDQREVCYGVPACLGGGSLANLGTLAPAVDISATKDPSPAGTPGVVPGSFVGESASHPYASRELKGSWSAPTGTLGLEWQPDHSTLAYVKYSRGYKTGGFNSGSTGVFETTPETQPESIDAYEIGLKETWNHTLQTNISAFYYNYYDAQIPVTQIPPLGALAVAQTVFYNLPKVVSEGIELESIYSPIRHLNIIFTYAYDYASVHDGCCIVDGTDPTATQLGAKPVASTAVGLPGSATYTVAQDLKGSEMPGSPRNKIALNGNYTWDFDNYGRLEGSLSYLWKDVSYSSIFNRYYNLVPTQQQWDTRWTWTEPHGRYSVVLYGQNIFNETIFESKSGFRQANTANPTNNNTSFTIYESYTLAPPRTYGVQLQYRF